MPRQYVTRHVGDVIANGAVLVERVNSRLWAIKCNCGNVFVAQPSSTSGFCRQCGYKHNSSSRIVHGESPSDCDNASRLYGIWLGMRTRCNNPNRPDYHAYGGRGISVCDEWNDYLCFKDWAIKHGYDESLTLDRINVNGNYEPSNCRWITRKEQCRNKRGNHFVTFDGQTKTLVEWSELTNIPYHTLKARINRYGFTVEDALTSPVAHGGRNCLNE